MFTYPWIVYVTTKPLSTRSDRVFGCGYGVLSVKGVGDEHAWINWLVDDDKCTKTPFVSTTIYYSSSGDHLHEAGPAPYNARDNTRICEYVCVVSHNVVDVAWRMDFGGLLGWERLCICGVVPASRPNIQTVFDAPATGTQWLNNMSVMMIMAFRVACEKRKVVQSQRQNAYNIST